MSESQTTIVLADDHAVVRSGLRMLLDAEADLAVTAESDTVEETVRKLRAYKPDVLVLDVNMGPEMSLPALPKMHEASPRTRVVVLTMEAETAFAREALRAGATGYLLKEAADTELVEAVRRAAAGEAYVQPSIGARLAADPEEQWPPEGLSEREAEVLRLIALGHTNKEIGEQLYLSVRTVESHRAHIQQKLQLETRAELVRFALDHGMLERAGGSA